MQLILLWDNPFSVVSFWKYSEGCCERVELAQQQNTRLYARRLIRKMEVFAENTKLNHPVGWAIKKIPPHFEYDGFTLP
jgi:hypothetical protein